MYADIARIADNRLVTAEDFRPFIGERNWMVIDADDPILPVTGDPIADNCDAIVEIKIRRVLPGAKPDHGLPNGAVEILVIVNNEMDNFGNGVARIIDADELAIRIEAS